MWQTLFQNGLIQNVMLNVLIFLANVINTLFYYVSNLLKEVDTVWSQEQDFKTAAWLPSKTAK